MLGTPGYMAPEQMRGDDGRRGRRRLRARRDPVRDPRRRAAAPARPRPRSRARSPQPTGSAGAARARPRDPARARRACASTRSPSDPTARPTARALAERVAALPRRRSRSSSAAARSPPSCVAARARRSRRRRGRRAEAMRAAGRALALDPESPSAAELVTRADARAAARDRRPSCARCCAAPMTTTSAGTRAPRSRATSLIASFMPVLIWNGIVRWAALVAAAASAVALAIAARAADAPAPSRSVAWMVIYAIGNATMLCSCAIVHAVPRRAGGGQLHHRVGDHVSGVPRAAVGADRRHAGRAARADRARGRRARAAGVGAARRRACCCAPTRCSSAVGRH